MGKLLISHRYNHLPLLPSRPGGFIGAGRIRLTRRKSTNFYIIDKFFNTYLSKLPNTLFINSVALACGLFLIKSSSFAKEINKPSKALVVI